MIHILLKGIYILSLVTVTFQGEPGPHQGLSNAIRERTQQHPDELVSVQAHILGSQTQVNRAADCQTQIWVAQRILGIA
jgi:hypothetical protein